MDDITIIGLKELRENMEVYITKIQEGGSFVVVRKSKVVFRIAPPEEKESSDEWEEVVDFTKIKKGGIEIQDILTRLE